MNIRNSLCSIAYDGDSYSDHLILVDEDFSDDKPEKVLEEIRLAGWSTNAIHANIEYVGLKYCIVRIYHD